MKGRGPDRGPRKPRVGKSKSIGAYGFETVQRRSAANGREPKVTAWCYVCGVSHAFTPECLERRRA